MFERVCLTMLRALEATGLLKKVTSPNRRTASLLEQLDVLEVLPSAFVQPTGANATTDSWMSAPVQRPTFRRRTMCTPASRCARPPHASVSDVADSRLGCLGPDADSGKQEGKKAQEGPKRKNLLQEGENWKKEESPG